jgi:hypothetical protein
MYNIYVYVYMYMYIITHTHTHTHTPVYIYIYIPVQNGIRLDEGEGLLKHSQGVINSTHTRERPYVCMYAWM